MISLLPSVLPTNGSTPNAWEAVEMTMPLLTPHFHFRSDAPFQSWGRCDVLERWYVTRKCHPILFLRPFQTPSASNEEQKCEEASFPPRVRERTQTTWEFGMLFRWQIFISNINYILIRLWLDFWLASSSSATKTTSVEWYDIAYQHISLLNWVLVWLDEEFNYSTRLNMLRLDWYFGTYSSLNHI